MIFCWNYQILLNMFDSGIESSKNKKFVILALILKFF